MALNLVKLGIVTILVQGLCLSEANPVPYGFGRNYGSEPPRDWSQPSPNSFAIPGAPPMPGGAFSGGMGGFKSSRPSSGIGNVVANARGEGGNVASNAVSSRGGNVLSNALGGYRASSLAVTGGGGDSEAISKSWGAGGTKSNSFA